MFELKMDQIASKNEPIQIIQNEALDFGKKTIIKPRCTLIQAVNALQMELNVFYFVHQWKKTTN